MLVARPSRHRLTIAADEGQGKQRPRVVKDPSAIPSCSSEVQDGAVEADVDREAPSRDEDPTDRLEHAYRAHGARLWRAVLLATGSREVADDAVAEAFAQALRRGTAVRDPAAWLWRAAFRIAGGEMKVRGSMASFVDEPVRELPEPFLDLWRALAQLPERQRTSVVLADYAGWSHREIAHAIGSTVSAVGVHVHRARRRLRELLEEPDGD
jgi:RNA polymerase sigma-70 factor (ECF subfamily)